MAPGQRKLRDSCDACHIAKVKCIKTETGECLRCVSSATICSFSPSDRRGKPRGAKNKCNRHPPPEKLETAFASKTKPFSHSHPSPTSENVFSLPNYDLDQRPSEYSHGDMHTVDTWTAPPPEEISYHMNFSQQENAMVSMLQTDWQNLSPMSLTSDQMSLQSSTPTTSISSLYGDPMLGCSPPILSQQRQQLFHQQYQEAPVLEDVPAAPFMGLQHQSSQCECHPITLQHLYALHSEAISASNGSISPFDVALFINNRAIERCHVMLSCTDCVLNNDTQRTSTNMLALAGTMDDILASYSTTCVAYLDGPSLDPLVFSSSESTTGSSSCNSPKLESSTGLSSRAQSMSSASSGASSATKMSMNWRHSSSNFSLGTYRVEGEDGRHLKLEIIKIELRKMERLWTAFRDTCAHQNCEDDQKSLYAALVCYLAKKMRSTTEMLDSRRRPSGCGW